MQAGWAKRGVVAILASWGSGELSANRADPRSITLTKPSASTMALAFFMSKWSSPMSSSELWESKWQRQVSNRLVVSPHHGG